MEEIISKISELNINGYFDHSNGYVVVWFHSNTADKSDIVAYLKSDMSWDVREVLSEESKLTADQEIVVIKHKQLSIENSGSTFDLIVRKMLKGLIDAEKGKLPPSISKMKEVLEKNSYGLLVLN